MKWMLLMLAIFMLACNSEEKQGGPIFLDYKVTGEEGLYDVTILIRFRAGKPDSKTISLKPPASVSFDGRELRSDSTEFTGPYYETQRSLDSMQGTHSITFKDENGKEHREDFQYNPFSLVSEIPATIERGDLELTFEGIDNEELLVVLTDTSFATSDFNETRQITGGVLRLNADELQSLTDGPIYAEFYMEKLEPIELQNGVRGKLVLAYTIKRQFELVSP